MDDAAFQQELRNLKQRVAQMAATYQRSPTGMPSRTQSSDAFLYHLQDVKGRLQSMQACLDYLTTDEGKHSGDCWTLSSDEDWHAPFSRDSFLPHNRLALPSPPLFWQLFTALRSDVRSIDTRLADVEQGVSDLEDRVDRLDPSQVTPATSDTEIPHHPTWSENYRTTSPREEPWRFWPVDSNDAVWTPQHVHQRPSELDGDYGMASRDMLPTIAFPFKKIPTTYGTHHAPAPEGVTFRDREISRLEELVKGAHDDLKRSEIMGSQQDVEIEKLRTEKSACLLKLVETERKLNDREETLTAYSRMLSERRMETETLQAYNESKDEVIQTWIAKHYNLQQSYMRKKSQQAAADRQIQQLQRALYNVQGSKQDEIEDIVASKEHELARLRDFCESKDAIVHQQEQIISRGAALIEEKDDTIERLGRALKADKDELENEIRQKERFSRLFNERGEVIEQLRASLNQALTPKPIRATRDTKTAIPSNQLESQQTQNLPPYSPFATVGKKVHTPENQKWIPRAINGYGKLPHEMKRAALWKNGPDSCRQSFGTPSIGLAQSQRREERSEADTRRLRHSASVKLLRRLAFSEEAESSSHRPKGGRSNPRAVPSLDELSRRPPLPAPLPPRIGLHMSTNPAVERDHRPILKHRSMQDLPSRTLHAYVEDEQVGEQDGGGGGGDA